jgi:hypothetical protein
MKIEQEGKVYNWNIEPSFLPFDIQAPYREPYQVAFKRSCSKIECSNIEGVKTVITNTNLNNTNSNYVGIPGYNWEDPTSALALHRTSHPHTLHSTTQSAKIYISSDEYNTTFPLFYPSNVVEKWLKYMVKVMFLHGYISVMEINGQQCYTIRLNAFSAGHELKYRLLKAIIEEIAKKEKNNPTPLNITINLVSIAPLEKGEDINIKYVPNSLVRLYLKEPVLTRQAVLECSKTLKTLINSRPAGKTNIKMDMDTYYSPTDERVSHGYKGLNVAIQDYFGGHENIKLSQSLFYLENATHLKTKLAHSTEFAAIRQEDVLHKVGEWRNELRTRAEAEVSYSSPTPGVCATVPVDQESERLHIQREPGELLDPNELQPHYVTTTTVPSQKKGGVLCCGAGAASVEHEVRFYDNKEFAIKLKDEKKFVDKF